MIPLVRSFDELREALEGFEPTAIVFRDDRIGSVELKVSSIQYGEAAIVTYYAKRPNDACAFGYPTLREACKHIGIE